jgi:hypothetical protein
LKNAATLHRYFPWLDEDQGVDVNGLPLQDGFVHFDAMSFKIDTTNKPVALVSMGVSDGRTWNIKPGPVCPGITIPVGRAATMLGLYYVTECECRHTDTIVGSLRLRYETGEDEILPLVVGRQLGWMDRPYATSEATAVQKGWLWRTTCDPSRKLKSFTIHMDVPDAQIGLIAASIVE